LGDNSNVLREVEGAVKWGQGLGRMEWRREEGWVSGGGAGGGGGV
jgi:hypothetical protein